MLRSRSRRSSLIVALGLVLGVLLPVAAPAGTAPASADPWTGDRPPLVPQPTAWVPGDGEWSPDASTRILLVAEVPEVYPASATPPAGLTGAPADGTVPDTTPSSEPAHLAAEAARLAAELAALGVVAAAPPLAVVSPLEADRSGTPADIRIRVGIAPHGADQVAAGDEAGRLEIDAKTGVTVSATTDAGVFRATRALLQLLTATDGHAPAGVYDLVPASEVRAVHLDIARKTYSLDVLKRFVDELAWNGLGELELHVSEFEGFALESQTHPEIQSPTVLRLDELRALLAYAEAQHVTVTPSLDMPGHLEHVLEARPEFRLLAADGTEVYGALDVTNPAAVDFAHELIAEYAAIFEPGVWNLGADEFVDFRDGNEVAALTSSARAAHGPDATAYDAMTTFVNETAAFLAELGFRTRVWSDGMLRASVVQLDPAVEIAHWTRRPAGSVAASAFADRGYRLVNVNDEYLYFVLGERVEYFYPTGEAILASWRPALFAGDDEVTGSDRVAGAMFAIWSDIPDALTEDAVLDRARLPIQAMSVRAWAPDAPLSFAQLADIAVAIGPAPTGLDGVQAAPIVPPSIAPTATVPTGAVEEPQDAGSISKRLLAVIGLIALTVAGLVVAVVLVLRRRANRAARASSGRRALGKHVR